MERRLHGHRRDSTTSAHSLPHRVRVPGSTTRARATSVLRASFCATTHPPCGPPPPGGTVGKDAVRNEARAHNGAHGTWDRPASRTPPVSTPPHPPRASHRRGELWQAEPRNGYEGGGPCAMPGASSRTPTCWGLGVRASRPASRAPKDTTGESSRVPHGSDPPRALPWPTAIQRTARACCSQSAFSANVAGQLVPWCPAFGAIDPAPHLTQP